MDLADNVINDYPNYNMHNLNWFCELVSSEF